MHLVSTSSTKSSNKFKKAHKHLYTMGKKLCFKGEPHETYIAPPLCNMSFLKCHFSITYLPSEQVYLKCQLWNYCLSCHRLFLPSNNMFKRHLEVIPKLL